MKALERLIGYSEQHFIGETSNEIILSDKLMKLFDLNRVEDKTKANKYLNSLAQHPIRYPMTIEFLDLMIHFVNGTALNIPE